MKLAVAGSGSSGNCYVLEDDGRRLILDAGCKYRDIQAAAGFQIISVDGCLVGHNHGDHAQSIAKISKDGINCYAGAKSVEPIYNATGCLVTPLKERKWNNIGRWSVIPLEVHHDVPCYGFIVGCPGGEKLFYATDFSYIGHDDKEYTVKSFGIDHFLIAVNYTGEPDIEDEKSGHIYGGHSSLDYVKRYLTKSITDKCRSVIACHLSKDNADEQIVVNELMDIAPRCKIGIARKGKVFNL